MRQTETVQWPLVEILRKKKTNILQDIFTNSIKRLSKKLPLIAPSKVHPSLELKTLASGVPNNAKVQVVFPDDRMYSLSNPGDSLSTNDGFKISYLLNGEIEFKTPEEEKYTGTIVRIITEDKELARTVISV